MLPVTLNDGGYKDCAMCRARMLQSRAFVQHTEKSLDTMSIRRGVGQLATGPCQLWYAACTTPMSMMRPDPAKTSLTHTCCNDWTKNRTLALVHWPEQRIEPSKKAVFSPTIR